MECPACGRTIKNNSKFCQYCGTTLIKARSKQNIKTQPCPVCGASLKPGISFCTQCGTPVKRPGSETEENHSKRRKKILPIVILFFLLLSGCLLFLVSIKSGLISIKLPLFSEHTTQSSQVDDGSSDRSELNDHADAGTTAPSDNSNDSAVSEVASNSEETTSSKDVDPIEELSSSIMRSRNTIDKEIELGKYTLSDFGNNKLYSNHDVPVALFCPDEQGQNGYKRSYYYMEGGLLFAEYAGNDLHQFYFNNGELIRWSYCPNPRIDSSITNYDNENTEPYIQWEEQILEESQELLEEWEKAKTAVISDSSTNNNDNLRSFYGIWIFASKDRNEAENSKKEATSKGFVAEIFETTDWGNLNDNNWFVVTTGIYQDENDAKNALNHVLEYYPDAYIKFSGTFIHDYIIPDSDQRYIGPSELVDLSRMEVRTAINELYARHGRKFTDKSIQSYFDSKSWYKPQIDPNDFSEEVFNDFETKNKEVLVDWEINHGWREGSAVDNP